MTPEARIESASGLLDAVLDGQPAEQALTRWARANRYAGSKDRAAVRDLVFDALRRKRSYAAYGGALTGRGLMLGAVLAEGVDPDRVFTGAQYAPEPVSDDERARFGTPDAAEARDLPDWLWPDFQASLGNRAEDEARRLRDRAEVDLRVNLLKGDRSEVQQALSDEGIPTASHPLSPTALRVIEGARRVHLSQAYQTGLVELQDAASQAVVDLIGLTSGQTVLDFCAGGGGKALAMAAQTGGPVVAHDVDPQRMRDIAPRAARAGAKITATEAPEGHFDVVLCDAPCSGSGSWRRAPEAKWRLTPERLDMLLAQQDAVLQAAQGLVARGGFLAYATCSLLDRENGERISDFLARTVGWEKVLERRFTLADGADGFYLCVLRCGRQSLW